MLYFNAEDHKLGSSTYFFLLVPFLVFTNSQVLSLKVPIVYRSPFSNSKLGNNFPIFLHRKVSSAVPQCQRANVPLHTEILSYSLTNVQGNKLEPRT